MAKAVRCRIAGEMDAKQAVLEASRIARQVGFREAPATMIATAVSELARNILKYASRGEILLEEAFGPTGRGVRITASDSGPGIADVETALKDHQSTGGTLGLGLPGVRRMMDDFCLDSQPGEGTRVTAVKWL